jgi:hypothetical protein
MAKKALMGVKNLRGAVHGSLTTPGLPATLAEADDGA